MMTVSKLITSAVPVKVAGALKVDASVSCHVSNRTGLPSREVSYIVIHYTGNPADTALANARYFSGANRKASAHYFVDDSHIYQSVEARDKAWHCGSSSYRHPACRNYNSIGIEMCTSGGYRVSDKTKSNAASLAAAWCRLLGITADEVDKYVLRHYDVTGKRCPAQMAGEGNREWTLFKGSIKKALGAPSVSTFAETTTTGKGTCNVELPVLKKGMKSGYVKTLQILLNKYNKAGLAEDGDFGAGTDRAVRDYQRSREIGVDGIVGSRTWAQLLK